MRHLTENRRTRKRSSLAAAWAGTLVCMPSFVCFQASFCPQPVDYLFHDFSLHATEHCAAELDARYTQRGHPSWKAFAAAEASLWASFSSATGPGWEGRQGVLNSFGKSHSISQLLNVDDSLSLVLKASEHPRSIYASTCNCSCTVSSLRERQHYTRPTHLPAQRIKQKGPGALFTVWRVWVRFIFWKIRLPSLDASWSRFDVPWRVKQVVKTNSVYLHISQGVCDRCVCFLW